MSAPVSMLPRAENDARPARSVCFTSRSGAEAHARRCARAESPSGLVTGVPFVTALLRAVEGGPAFEVALGTLDWEVRQLSPAEVTRRQQAGMRAAVALLLDQAEEWEAAAAATRIGNVRAEWLRQAREARSEAREIELQLTIFGVRPAAALADDTEPTLSAERDSQVSL